jgi:3-hydroxyisobutyrate dehydrogenase
MIVAFAGNGALDQVVASRLGGKFRVEPVADAAALERLAGACDVLVLGGSAGEDWGEQLGQWKREAFGSIEVVVDQRVVDPERTRELATSLESVGIALVDAPIHCEKTEEFPQVAATLCGGADAAVAKVRPVLEAMGAKVIHFGAVGSGHTARLLVGAAATCNRMATCEGAAAGFANGLSIADMALVLNRSSGVNSGTERVLPHLGTAARTTDMPLADVAREMRLASQLAMRAGTPLLIAGVATELCRSLANGLDEAATFDDAVASMEKAAGLSFGGR